MLAVRRYPDSLTNKSIHHVTESNLFCRTVNCVLEIHFLKHVHVLLALEEGAFYHVFLERVGLVYRVVFSMMSTFFRDMDIVC